MKPILIFFLFLISTLAQAHEGHVHGPEQNDNAPSLGPIVLTEATIRNLGIETVEAQPAPLQRTLRMAARIQGLPERQAKISPRGEGRVAEILVKLGDHVTAGQPLLRFDPLAVGNPRVTLSSPIDGYIVRQEVSLGQVLSPETAIMEVADYAQVLARAATFESPDLSAIKVGQPAEVRLDILGNETFTGKVQRLDVALEKESGTFEVYVLLENPELRLRPNMQAVVTLAVGEAHEALAVPERAVLGDIGNYFVFVQGENNEFERHGVVLGMRAGDKVEIVEGVLPGDKVITRGNYQLQFAAGAKKGDAASSAPALPKQKSAAGWLWALAGFVAGASIVAFFLRRGLSEEIEPPVKPLRP